MYPGGPAHANALPRIGAILAGKYELLRLLGEGGMAFVYEAMHLRLKQRVAIKLLAPDMARDDELGRRFEAEARAVAKLKTPHVARVMDVDSTEDNLPFIVMEFLEGRDLEGELSARHHLPVDEAVDYILQACAAMLEAHDMGIVHRDLKPANLFVTREGQDRVVKVLDFGISKVVGEATRLTGAGAVMGTVLYMSPEQIRASKDVDQRADIWSLGVILYELIAGRAPWEGNSHQIAAAIMGGNPPDIRSFAQVPDQLAQVITSMLERDPSRRVSSVMELILALAPHARADSLGGVIAGQLALGSTGARMRALSSREGRPGKGLTVPLMKGPPPPAYLQQSAPPANSPTPPPAKHEPKSKSYVALGILVGLVGAVGVTLTIVGLWYARKPRAIDVPHPPPSGEVTQDAATSVTPSASASASVSVPPPPPTGTATATTRRPGTKPAPSARGSASASPGENPPHL